MEYEYIRTPKVDANCTKEQFVHELDNENTREENKEFFYRKV